MQLAAAWLSLAGLLLLAAGFLLLSRSEGPFLAGLGWCAWTMCGIYLFMAGRSKRRPYAGRMVASAVLLALAGVPLLVAGLHGSAGPLLAGAGCCVWALGIVGCEARGGGVARARAVHANTVLLGAASVGSLIYLFTLPDGPDDQIANRFGGALLAWMALGIFLTLAASLSGDRHRPSPLPA